MRNGLSILAAVFFPAFFLNQLRPGYGTNTASDTRADFREVRARMCWAVSLDGHAAAPLGLEPHTRLIAVRERDASYLP